ncbi:hypothetical protein B0T11DRAFT_329058 [Plectosphaerella cucumerina]|uniref:Uncharacterized protein n=1 Tax=Plectosphaerella cucumerina TaxID=40658 RepID=A0A8K0TMT1_9PEZI|nr:hypothetical protein B0T11DRAFT_329058 [Plectosphaerella cucumerina]
MAAWVDISVRVAGLAGTILAFPLRIVWALLMALVGILLTILAPAIYMSAYFVSWLQSILGFFVSLEPLYTFLACGAVVGAFSGIFLATTSSVITSTLGMQDEPKDGSEYDSSMATPSMSTMSTPALRPLSSRTEDSSSFETDWQLLEKMPPSRRRRTAGLVTQTIHEEDSTETEA